MTTITKTNIFVFAWMLALAWPYLLWISLKKPLSVLCHATFAMLILSGVTFATSADVQEQWDSDILFIKLKRPSILLGYFAMLGINTFRAGRLGLVFRRLITFCLFVNIAEVAYKSYLDSEYPVFVLALATMCFPPDFKVNEEGYVRVERFAWWPRWMTPRLYFRMHYIAVASWYPFGVNFHDRETWIGSSLPALVPLAVMELFYAKRPEMDGQIFMVRAFGLVWLFIVDSFVWAGYANVMPSSIDFIADSVLVRNVGQIVCIILLSGLCLINERFRGLPATKQNPTTVPTSTAGGSSWVVEGDGLAI